jgi:hydrogenase maturation protease
MSDEGIGSRLVRELAERCGERPDVEFLDVGTGSSLRVLHAISGRRKVVFVDCAMMGEPPGSIRRFTPAEVESTKELPLLSLHEGDPLGTLRLARSLGECPGEVVIFGIQPQNVEPGRELSPELERRLADYVKAIRAELD